jgi:hypothetical protein
MQPSDLGLNPDVPVPECATEPVEWAGLQLELCINDVPDAAQDDRPTEEVAFYYNRYVPSAPGGGWVVASGYIDNEGLTGSVGWATRADDLSSAVSERLGMAIEGAVNGTAPAPVALQLVDDAGLPLVAVPAGSSYLQYKQQRVFIKSWSTSGDADDRPPDVAPSELPRSGYLAPIPWVDGAVALEVVSLTDGTVLDSMRLDSEAPVAPESVDVNAGTVDNNETITIHGNRTETVSWERAASGGVTAEQTFGVLWSNDGFATSIPVAVGVTGSEVMLQNTSYLPAGDNVQVRVVPGGVMHTDNGDDGTTSEPFSVPAGPPLVAVAGAPDEPVEHGDPIDLHAIVVQPPTTGDGDVDASDFIIWHDQFDGRLFEGQLLTARDLRPGTHTIGMNIDSPDGGEATAEVVFEVVAEPSPTPSGDALDPVSARLVPADLEPTSTGATPAGPWPGPQSCGSNECVGDFIAACEEAGGLPMDVGPVPPSPDGVEVECQQISTQEE